MDRQIRQARLRLLLDEMQRPMVYRLARGIAAPITPDSKKERLIDAVAETPIAVLRRVFAKALADADLRTLCRRFGYSDRGSSTKLANRLVDAVEERSARITRWRPFDAARSFARSLGLNSQNEWRAFSRGKLADKGPLPDDVPAAPWLVYKTTWTTWGDFLGTDNPARHLIEHRPFAKARAYVRSLGLTNASEWKEYCAKRIGNRRVLPPDIPSAPDRVYADQGWISFGDWLGNDHVHASKIEYASYDDARAFVRSIGIQTETEWRAYCRGEIHRSTPRPLQIPTNPHRTYRGRGWKGWGHFLGTNAVAVYNRKFRSYEAARAYVRKQGLVDSKDWRTWCASGKRPPDIPGAPDLIYKDKGWTTWGDFFGSTNIHPAQMMTAREAMPIVRALGIRNRTEFLKAKRSGQLPNNIPLTIDRRPDWTDWASFLGTG